MPINVYEILIRQPADRMTRCGGFARAYSYQLMGEEKLL
jgi:hypothetical protein